jgi:MFS family permease
VNADAAEIIDSTGSIAPPPRQAFAALRDGAFRAYFGTSLLSMMGDNVEHVISYWVMFQAFHSPTLAGFAVISHWTPFLVLGVWFGSLADRYDCRRIIQISQVAFIAASLAWALLFLTGTLQTWHAVILLIVHGVAGALWSPASQLIIHDMVGREHLQSGVRLNSTGRSIGILFGPAVGGALLLLLGPAYGLMANALLYLPMTIWLLRTPYTGHQRDTSDVRSPALTIGDAIRTIREVADDKGIIVMVALAGLSSLFVGNAYQAQMPEFAASFGSAQDEITYSVLLTASAAGAVLGGLGFEAMAFFHQPRIRVAILLAVAWAASILVFAITPFYALAVLALFSGGFLNIGFTSMAQAYVQLEAPPERRGRVVGVFSMSWNGLRVGSGVTVGIAGAVIGVHSSLALSAAAFIVVGVALLWYAHGRAREAAPV